MTHVCVAVCAHSLMCTCVYMCVAKRGNQGIIHISYPLFHVLGPQPQLLITVLLILREGVTESHFNPFLLENSSSSACL